MHRKIIVLHFIACCPTISFTLAGDVENIHSHSEGIYSYKGTINGRDYWVKVGGGDRALWYMGPDSKDWSVGKENNLGYWGYILSSLYLETTCPTNSKNDWIYLNDNKWIPTNDVQLNCIGNHT